MLQDLMTINELRKEFIGAFTLGPLNFSIKKGETIAILGHNGAGKTTLFQLLTGNIYPSEGSILFQSQKLTPDNSQIKKNIGYLPQALNFPKWVNGNDLLDYFTALLQMKNRRQAILEQFDRWDCQSFKYKPLAACSHGMQKRIGLAISSIHNPSLLILDEPFSGLDLYHIRNLTKLIKDRQISQQATLLSTHIIPYAADLCQRAFIIQKGKLQAVQNWHNLSYTERINAIEEKL